MTCLYIAKHPLGVTLRTRLPGDEREKIGDISMLLIDGEAYGGLTYSQLERIAATSGMIDADELSE